MEQVNGSTPHPRLAFMRPIVFPVFHLLCCVGTQSRTTKMATIGLSLHAPISSVVFGRKTDLSH